MRKRHFNFKNNLLGICLILLPQAGLAQTLTEDRPLSFGDIAIVDNNIQREIELHPDGTYTADPGYYFYSDTPELGRYIITGQTPSALMDITIDMTSTALGLAHPVFTVHNPFTVPAVVITDGLGNATFEIGATLRSSGSGTNYSDQPYSGVFTVNVTPQ